MWFGFVVVGSVLGQSVPADVVHAELAADRVRAFASALEENDELTAFRFLDPRHLATNIVLYERFSLDNPKMVNFAICNWGLMAEPGSPFLRSISQIESVDETYIEATGAVWRVYLDVTLVDDRQVVYSILMDPETLLLSGASG